MVLLTSIPFPAPAYVSVSCIICKVYLFLFDVLFYFLVAYESDAAGTIFYYHLESCSSVCQPPSRHFLCVRIP